MTAVRTLGLELSDAGFVTALAAGDLPQLIEVPDRAGSPDWPGFCHADGPTLTFGRAAEDLWFVQPRRVVHNLWARLAHEPSTLHVSGKPPSFSELAFFFLRDFAARLALAAPSPDRMVLALPSAYFKDAATEEEKVGLILGMAGELKLPLAGLIDMACAGLCDPRGPGFNHSRPVIVVDVGLDEAEFTLVVAEDKLARKGFMLLPQCGQSHLLKQLTATMGNRFLRHTAFDILEDGRIEQTFFRQTKEFVCGESPEFRYLINTSTRAYEMQVKRDQLCADAQGFVATIVQGLQSFAQGALPSGALCTLALTDRAARLPGLEPRLRASGFPRILRLPRGAAAAGAAQIGVRRLSVPADLADVPVETAVHRADACCLVATPWEARLVKLREPGPRLPPTHAILNGTGVPIGHGPRFTIGPAETNATLALPQAFNATGDCTVTLAVEDGRLWFTDASLLRESGTAPGLAVRLAVEAGDRLALQAGPQNAEILFAHCPNSRRD
jgi:hypothetical protein